MQRRQDFRGVRRALPVKPALVAGTAVSCLALVLATGDPRAGAVEGPSGYTSVLRVHAGEQQLTDSRKLKWTPDTDYATGGEVRSVDVEITGTDDPHLYTVQRWGNFSYDLPVANGSYRLQLSFAEVQPQDGARAFSVRTGDRTLLDQFVITDHVKQYQALVVWLTVDVQGGSLPLEFSSDEGVAAVAGVELLRKATVATSSPTVKKSTQPAPSEPDMQAASVPATETDLPGWKYLFGDSFDTAASAGQFLSKYPNWDAYKTGWPDTSKRGTYDTNRLSVANGALNIAVGPGPDGKPRAAVPYPLINGRNAADPSNQTYGRYEVRFRADPVKGYKTAFLLWPESEVWPRDGEIDFPEGDLDGTISAFMHRQNGTSGGDQDAFSTKSTYTSWRTATIEWTPDAIRFFLDGKVVGESTERIPNTPMRWALQTETCLGGCDIPAGSQGKVQIDYVKVWRYEP
jgi:hypothetical protein